MLPSSDIFRGSFSLVSGRKDRGLSSGRSLPLLYSETKEAKEELFSQRQT